MALSRMMAKNRRGTGQRTAQVFTQAAPVDGLNKKSALTDMKLTEAVRMVNLIPDVGRVRTRYGVARRGSVGAHSGYQHIIINPWNGAELWLCGPSNIRRVQAATGTTSQNIAADVAASAMSMQFSTTGQNFLCILSTSTALHTLYFDLTAGNYVVENRGPSMSSSWIASGTTKLFPSYRGFHVHAERIWFFGGAAEEDKLTLAYLPTASVQGLIKQFPMGSVFNKATAIVGMQSWTRDGGDGMDDYLCIFSDRGEVAIYQGTDPESIDTFQKVGVFDIGVPVTTDVHAFARTVLKVGGDIGVITTRGVAMMSQLMANNKSGHEKVAITYHIAQDFQDVVKVAGNDTNWSLVELPHENCILINYNRPDSTQNGQFVLNVATGSWAKWTGLDARQWAISDRSLAMYIDPAGTLFQYGDIAMSDAGTPITYTLQWAYTLMRTPLSKSVGAVRVHCAGPSDHIPKVEIKSDFDASDPTFSGGQATDSGKSASTSVSNPSVVSNYWQTIQAEGYSFSACLQGSTTAQVIEINAIDFLYETGDIL